jgi:aminoglycoside phosphotransferase (APT) family kinase protein
MPVDDLLTPSAAVPRLAALGVNVDPGDLRLEPRDGRSVGRLSDGRLAWFATSDAGRTRMARERRVLRVLEARCRLSVPKVLAEASDGSVDVRSMVAGVHDGWTVFARLRSQPAAARDVGAALGAMVAEVHSNVRATDAAEWLPRVPEWPEPRDSIRDRLPYVVDDHALHAAADRVIAGYEETIEATPASDRALVHTDLGLHNAVIDPVTFRVNGIFDWETACWADRHLDFRYFLFELGRFEMLDAATTAYTSETGVEISRARVLLYNAACAIGYLAFRAGVPPEERWCGRTLAEDLEWTRSAIALVDTRRS